MRKVLVRELSRYSPESLSRKLSLDLDTTKACIESLSARGVLRLNLSTEQKEHNVSRVHSKSEQYQFSYVGLAVYADVVLIVYPKYLTEAKLTTTKLQQIFSVLRKSSANLSEIFSVSEEGTRSNNKLALILTLLEMFSEYGVYSNYVKVLNQNGQGNISWERTIAKHSPFIDDENTPIYFDFETVESARDVSDFVTRLHKCVLTQCSRFMQECGLSELLSLDNIDLSDEDIEDFGDTALINYRLEREYGVQFATWKQGVINLLRMFINDLDSVIQVNDTVSLGTTSFYNIWEKACKAALGDKVNTSIGLLGFQLAPSWISRSRETLMDLIPRPLWRKATAGGEAPCGDVATLIPDAVSFWETLEGERVFGIFDAKYYVPTLGRKTASVPGVESVSKQYLYQSAYRLFIQENGFKKVVNAFLVPTDGSVIEKQGRVEFPGVFPSVQEPFASDIAMYALPGEQIWQCYLSDKTLSTDELAELFD